MIVYVDMVADLFHPGHINFFKQIKEQYPHCKLYVGLMSDKEATVYKRKPILNSEERKTMVESCRFVDCVFPDAPMPITRDFIHGDDISDAHRNYWYKIPVEMGIYKEIPYTSSISTSQIIERIKNT